LEIKGNGTHRRKQRLIKTVKEIGSRRQTLEKLRRNEVGDLVERN